MRRDGEGLSRLHHSLQSYIASINDITWLNGKPEAAAFLFYLQQNKLTPNAPYRK